MASVFFSYSHADEALRDQLEKQLAMLKRQGVIETWHDRRIGAGQDFGQAIDAHIESDDIILLLISPDFLASDYCYEREMTRAMARHEAGEAIVIPVILRACDWHGAPFGKLNASPPDGLPITQWPDRDQAFLEVAKAVRGAAKSIGAVAHLKPQTLSQRPANAPSAAASVDSIRSSNLRIAKRFSDRDKDGFRSEAFDYITKFFENSISELGARNPGVDGSFRPIDANRFTAAVYRDGRSVARCTIFMGGFSSGIAYATGETTDSNAFNENLTVEADDQTMFLRSMGMARLGGGQRSADKLSLEGAAEFYWGIFVEPLQRS